MSQKNVSKALLSNFNGVATATPALTTPAAAASGSAQLQGGPSLLGLQDGPSLFGLQGGPGAGELKSTQNPPHSGKKLVHSIAQSRSLAAAGDVSDVSTPPREAHTSAARADSPGLDDPQGLLASPSDSETAEYTEVASGLKRALPAVDLPSVEQRPVHIVSIMGTPRCGKSTLLSKLVAQQELKQATSIRTAKLGSGSSFFGGPNSLSHASGEGRFLAGLGPKVCTQGIDVASELFSPDQLQPSIGSETNTTKRLYARSSRKFKPSPEARKAAAGAAAQPQAPKGTSDAGSVCLMDVQADPSAPAALRNHQWAAPAMAVSSVIIWRLPYEGPGYLVNHLHSLLQMTDKLQPLVTEVAASPDLKACPFGHLVLALKDAKQFETTPGAIEREVMAAGATGRPPIQERLAATFSSVTFVPMASLREDEAGYMCGVGEIAQVVRQAAKQQAHLFGHMDVPITLGSIPSMWSGVEQFLQSERATSGDQDHASGADAISAEVQFWLTLLHQQQNRHFKAYHSQLHAVWAGSKGMGAALRFLGAGDSLEAADAAVEAAIAPTSVYKAALKLVALPSHFEAEMYGADDRERRNACVSGAGSPDADQAALDADVHSKLALLLLGGEAPSVEHAVLRVLHDAMYSTLDGRTALRLCLTFAPPTTVKFVGVSALRTLRNKVRHLLQTVVRTAMECEHAAAQCVANDACRALRDSAAAEAAAQDVASSARTEEPQRHLLASSIRKLTLACKGGKCGEFATKPSAALLREMVDRLAAQPSDSASPEFWSKRKPALHELLGAISERALTLALKSRDLVGVLETACVQAAAMRLATAEAEAAAELETPMTPTKNTSRAASALSLSAIHDPQSAPGSTGSPQLTSPEAPGTADRQTSPLSRTGARKAPSVPAVPRPLARDSTVRDTCWNSFQTAVAGHGYDPTERSQLRDEFRGILFNSKVSEDQGWADLYLACKEKGFDLQDASNIFHVLTTGK